MRCFDLRSLQALLLVLLLLVGCRDSTNGSEHDGSVGGRDGAVPMMDAGDDAPDAALDMDAANGMLGDARAGDAEPDDASSQADARASDDATTSLDSGSEPGAVFVYVGTGSWERDEPGGVTVFRLGPEGALSFVERVDVGDQGAFMAADLARHILYVADEEGMALRRFTVDSDTGRLTFDDGIDVSGTPVNITLDSTARTLLTASYAEGLARLFAVDDDGFVEPASDVETTGTEAHSIVVSPSDDFVYVCNKGSSSISQLAFDPSAHTFTPLTPATVAHEGGPRIAAFSIDARFLYVVSENGDSVRVYSRDGAGKLSEVQSVERLPAGETGTGAHVAVSPNGHLYVSNRGPSNSIAVYDIDATSGQLTLVEHVPTGGSTPRNFGIDPSGRYLLAGNQDSQNVAIFAIDAATGELTSLDTIDAMGSPLFVGAYAFGTAE